MSDNLFLVADIRAKDIKKESNRDGFGRGLVTAGKQNDQVVVICADLTDSTKISLFAEAFPERFVQAGVAEQNIVTVGSGMAAMGKVPFVSSYAAFCPGRTWEQIRTTVCLNDRNVKIIGAHAGLYTSPDGATHQALEDITLMRVLPNMVVLVPCDSVEAEKMAPLMAADRRPGYVRVARAASPVITTAKTPFEIGPAYVFRPGKSINPWSTLMPGSMSCRLRYSRNIWPWPVDCQKVSSYKMTPLRYWPAPGVVSKSSRYLRRFSSVHGTSTASKRFLQLALLSSAASKPLPRCTIFLAVSSSLSLSIASIIQLMVFLRKGNPRGVPLS